MKVGHKERKQIQYKKAGCKKTSLLPFYRRTSGETIFDEMYIYRFNFEKCD